MIYAMTLACSFPLIILTLNGEAKANQSRALQMVNLAKKLFKILSPPISLSSLFKTLSQEWSCRDQHNDGENTGERGLGKSPTLNPSQTLPGGPVGPRIRLLNVLFQIHTLQVSPHVSTCSGQVERLYCHWTMHAEEPKDACFLCIDFNRNCITRGIMNSVGGVQRVALKNWSNQMTRC